MLRIGWFSTGRGAGSLGLLRFVKDRLEATGIDAGIDFVFSNREPGESEGSDEFFQLVESYGLPLITHSSNRFRQSRGGRVKDHRDEFDRQVMGLFARRQPDICVLAGYMLIVGEVMCRTYPLLNLHPALPDGPIGTWQEVVWRLIEERANYTGTMIHLATEEVDRGPVVSYVRVPITGDAFDRYWSVLDGLSLEQIKGSEGEQYPLFQLIRQVQYRREPYLIFETIRQLSLGTLAVRGGQVLNADGNPLSESAPNGICLDREIEESMTDDVGRDED